MSLDFYLKPVCPECGHMDASDTAPGPVFEANVTHNVASMAGHVPIQNGTLYEIMWRPDEFYGEWPVAGEVAGDFEEALAYMRANRPALEPFNPENGWGSYEGLLSVVQKIAAACREYPKARVRVCR